MSLMTVSFRFRSRSYTWPSVMLGKVIRVRSTIAKDGTDCETVRLLGTLSALKSCFQCLSFKASDLRSEMRMFDFKRERSVSCTYSKAAYCRILVGISL